MSIQHTYTYAYTYIYTVKLINVHAFCKILKTHVSLESPFPVRYFNGAVFLNGQRTVYAVTRVQLY